MSISKRGDKEARRQHRIQSKMAALGIPDFETPTACAERQQIMVARFGRRGAQPETVEGLGDCSADTCGMFECRDGCHYAARRLRHNLVPLAAEFFSKHKGPLWFVTIVHPEWSWPSTQPFDPERIREAHQWLAARLERLNIQGLLAMGAWEFVLIEEDDGSRVWAGHMHIIVAGASHAALTRALAIRTPKTVAAYIKPVVIKNVGNLGRQIGYCIMRFGERRIPYEGRNGRVNQNHLPLRTPEQHYFDQTLCSLNIGARVFWFEPRPRTIQKIAIYAV